MVSLEAEKVLCNFGEGAGIWERASFNCDKQRMETPTALSKPQHPAINKCLLCAFWSDYILHVSVFSFTHVQVKTIMVIIFSIPIFRETS